MPFIVIFSLTRHAGVNNALVIAMPISCHAAYETLSESLPVALSRKLQQRPEQKDGLTLEL